MKHIAFLIIAALGGCIGFAQTAKAQKQTKYTDPEIASIAVVANQVDIQAAQLAQKKTKNTAVNDFAKTMIADHNSVIDQATALVKKLNVTPKSNSLSRKLASDGESTRNKLQSKTGAAFDKAYVDNEVAYHKAVIDVVTNTLIPQSQNAELKALLQNVVPILKTHLEHAEMLQKQLSGK